MKRLTACAFLAVVVLALSPAGARGQASPPAGRATLDAVVEELRNLRRAIERQSAMAGRSQLLMARLAMQDQRLARARQAVASEEDLVASAEQERGQAQNAAQEVARALGQATDDAARRELEDRARAIRAQLVALEATVNRAETRLTEAKQALDAESGRYDEIEALVDQLDRQLQGRGF